MSSIYLKSVSSVVRLSEVHQRGSYVFPFFWSRGTYVLNYVEMHLCFWNIWSRSEKYLCFACI